MMRAGCVWCGAAIGPQGHKCRQMPRASNPLRPATPAELEAARLAIKYPARPAPPAPEQTPLFEMEESP